MSEIAGLIEQARATLAARESASPAKSGERAELQRVAQQFEAMLLTQMLREMRKAGEVGKDDQGESGLSLGTESFTEAIDTELGIHLARHKGLGLANQLIQAFERLADVHGTPGSSRSAAVPQGAVSAASTGPTDQADAGPQADSGSVDAFEGQVTSAFGWRSDPFTGQAKFHKGIDLRAAYGQDIQAAAPGTVVFSGEQRGYGTTVVIEHADGSKSRYAHLSAAVVASGSTVAAGESVGRAGKSGRATGTHLHFEVTGPDGKPMSPSEWMQQRAETSEV